MVKNILEGTFKYRKELNNNRELAQVIIGLLEPAEQRKTIDEALT